MRLPRVLQPFVEAANRGSVSVRSFGATQSLPQKAYKIDFMFMEGVVAGYRYQGELNLYFGAMRTKRKTFSQGDMICMQDQAKLSAVADEGCLFMSVSHQEFERLFRLS